MKGMSLIYILAGMICIPGAIAGIYSGGSGTAEEPYQISTVTDWQELTGASGDWDKQFILLNDIDFGNASLTPVAPDTDPTTSGFQGTIFTGVLNGNGHTLSNASINLPDSDYVGLFGHVSGGQIRNLGIEYIGVMGRSSVGRLCGANGGTITSCYTMGEVVGDNFVGGLCGVNGGTISACYSPDDVTGHNDYVGGICGLNNGTINASYSTSSITGGQRVGSLCGSNEGGTISDCYALGPVGGDQYVGGVSGYNLGGTIRQCYAAGKITGRIDVGGIVGLSQRGRSCQECNNICHCSCWHINDWRCILECCQDKGIYNCLSELIVDPGLVTSCYWDILSCGINQSCGGEGKTTAEMKSLSTFIDSGWDFADTWWMPTEDYPRLQWQGCGSLKLTILPLEATTEGAQWRRVGTTEWLDSGQIETPVPAMSWDVEFKVIANLRKPEVIHVSISPNELTQIEATYTELYAAGNGTAEEPYQISTVTDWHWFMVDSYHWDKKFVLHNDIDFGGANLTPVAPDTIPGNYPFDGTAFTGIFDGNGHVLRNAVINLPDNDYVGLFGLLGSGGQIRNLGVENISVNGLFAVGGLCASNGDEDSNIEAGTIRNCYATGAVKGADCVGGLCGWNSGGTITTCYATGSVDGGDCDWSVIGGLCGWNDGTITTCYATNSVNSGGYKTFLYIGGLCGENDGTITTCYATGSVNSGGYTHTYLYIGGLCGSNGGTITTCYATGSVDGRCYNNQEQYIGGLCGWNLGTITTCYATGSVDGGGSNYVQSIGGLCGWNGDERTPGGPISGCFWDMETSHRTGSRGGTGKTTAEMKTLSTFTDAGWDFANTWFMPSYPRLRWEIVGYGSLQVTILPSEAIAEGAQWRRVGTIGWLDSGQIETSVPAVSWNVEFKPTANWIGPQPILVAVSPNELAIIEVTYTLAGSLQVMILPSEAVAEGAQWRRVGTKDWMDSGQIETGVQARIWNVEFKLTDNWNGPQPIQVLIFPKELIRIEAVYTMAYSGGSGTADDPYKISTVSDWQELISTIDDWNKQFILLNDIDFNGTNLIPVAPDIDKALYNGFQGTHFTGVFNGKGHVLRNVVIYLPYDEYLGVFGSLGTGGQINNLGIDNIVILGRARLGGLCGNNSGMISSCYTTGSINGFEYTQDLGGLCGENYGKISTCYAMGSVNGNEYVGGLCGENYGTISDCFWDMETSGQGSSAGGDGKTTAEMKTLATFTDAGWDFVGESINGTTDTWRMCANDIDYPRLSWEFSHGGDFDCPDGVAFDDFLYLAARWLTTTPDTIGSADANGDGKVDISDLAILGKNWMK
jgi:hypothetical protein